MHTSPTPSDSGREWVLRCREPFSIGALLDLDARSESTPVEIEDRSESDGAAIVGIASSTSVDSHGTEMSLDALTRMAEQMKRGIPLLPRHNNGTRAVEWDEVVGRTTGAEIERADVAAPGSPTEAGYRLRLTSVLYADDPMAQRLLRRLDRGEPIGQSIGGWFLSVRVVESDSGEVERVIVEDVELDHVALTRAPSNPDSIGLASLRSKIDEAHRRRQDLTMPEDCSSSDDEVRSAEPVSDDRATVAVPAPDGYHWMETDDGPVLMEGEDADHDGASEAFEFEVIEEHDDESERMDPDDESERMEHGDDDDDRGEHDDDERSYHDDDDERMEPEEDEQRMDDDEDERATPESIAVGDFVSVLDSEVESGNPGEEQTGGDLYGRVTEVVTEGSVAGSPVEASEADPLVRIEVYAAVGDGFEPSGDRVVYPVSKVQKIDPLVAPSENAEVESAVAEPAEAVASAEEPSQERAVAPFVEYPTAPEDTEWSWDADAANEVLGDPPDWERFASVHLYFDSGSPEVRSSYKLPVAKMIDGRIHVVLRGLTAAVAALNGARGGVDLSDDDRRAAYDRAVKFYSLFEDADAPPLRMEEDETDDRSSVDPVDVRIELVHDTGEHDSPDARSESPATTSTSDLETPMTLDLDALRAMIREEVARGKGEPRSAEPTTSESNAPESDTADLRSEIETLRATVTRLSAEPVRRGLAYQTTRTSGRGKVGGSMSALVTRAKSEAPAVSLVVERSVETLDANSATPRDLSDALAAVLRAAEGEGLLGNPNPARWA